MNGFNGFNPFNPFNPWLIQSPRRGRSQLPGLDRIHRPEARFPVFGQFTEGALFDKTALIEDDKPVGIFESAGAVRNDEHRPLGALLNAINLRMTFCSVAEIQGRGGFIQQENRRVPADGPSDTDTLALDRPTRNVHVRRPSIQPIGKPRNDFRQTRDVAGSLQELR